jgi:hypothetical protein
VRLTLLIALFAYVINLAWEYLHFPLYVHAMPHIYCAGIDALLVLALWSAGIALFGWGWERRMCSHEMGVIASLGILLAWAIELRALYLGTWSYAPAMPVLPLLHVGMSPILQLAIVPIVCIWLSVRIAAARA